MGGGARRAVRAWLGATSQGAGVLISIPAFSTARHDERHVFIDCQFLTRVDRHLLKVY